MAGQYKQNEQYIQYALFSKFFNFLYFVFSCRAKKFVSSSYNNNSACTLGTAIVGPVNANFTQIQITMRFQHIVISFTQVKGILQCYGSHSNMHYFTANEK